MEWNEFRRSESVRGLSQREVSKLYRSSLAKVILFDYISAEYAKIVSPKGEYASIFEKVEEFARTLNDEDVYSSLAYADEYLEHLGIHVDEKSLSYMNSSLLRRVRELQLIERDRLREEVCEKRSDTLRRTLFEGCDLEIDEDDAIKRGCVSGEIDVLRERWESSPSMYKSTVVVLMLWKNSYAGHVFAVDPEGEEYISFIGIRIREINHFRKFCRGNVKNVANYLLEAIRNWAMERERRFIHTHMPLGAMGTILSRLGFTTAYLYNIPDMPPSEYFLPVDVRIPTPTEFEIIDMTSSARSKNKIPWLKPTPKVPHS